MQARRRAAEPLRYARLWHQEAPATSQRAICAPAADPGIDAVLARGGNGSGKSFLVAQLAVATAGGRRDPATLAWCEANGFPLARLPDRPGRVIVSALTSNDSRRVLRPKIASLVPIGTTWKNEDGNGEAEARLPNGGVIVFKSNDQGRRSYQGDWADLIVLDEEHDADVFGECMMRVARVPGGQGWIVLSMTPLKGRTWVYDDFIRAPKPGHAVVTMHAQDNPYLPAEKMERALSRYGAHEQAARRHGEFVSLEGRVYSMFARHLHVVRSFPIPSDWPRFRAIDFGTANPFACLWAALDQEDNVLHVYREHYQRNWTDRQHAERIILLSHGESILWTVADSAAAGSRLSFATEHGIPTLASQKDIRDGINAVSQRLSLDAMDRPHLLIHDCCIELLAEIESYTWATRSGPSDDPDMPLKANDHAMDALRYLVMTLRSSLRLAEAA